MENKYLIIGLVMCMLVLPMVSADNSGWKLYPDRSEYNGVEDNDPEFWIDKYHTDENGNKVYHIDALRDLYIDENNESNNEKVRLYLPYLVQPDWIKHINHEGEYVRTYFPTNEDWEWEYECDEEVEDCSEVEGYVILRVDKIDEGLGSNTFPIGITGPTWATNGQQYGEFDGDSSEITGTNVLLNTSYGISYSAWIYVDNNKDTSPIISIGNSTGALSLVMQHNSSRTVADHGPRLQCTGCNDTYLSGSQVLPNQNQWYFITATYNGTYFNVYIDSVFSISDDSNFTLQILESNYSIGGKKHGSNTFASGGLDEVLVYNRTLSQAEITALYANYTVTSTGVNRTGTPSTEGLVLDINFDDYSVADNSGSGNHGANTNVTFGDVYTDEVTLTEGTDYNTSGTTFNILNTDYSWSWINTSYNWLQTNSSITRQITGNGTLALSSFMSNATTWLSLLGVVIIMMIISVVVIVVNKFGRTTI